MDKLLYVGMTGAKHIERAQTINANNLANASTAGFRADFQSLLSMPVDGAGMATRVNAVSIGQSSDFTPGTIQSTGRDLDVAIQGAGFFAVQDADGREAYSRRGDFRITSDGMLLDGAGRPVMGDGGPVAIPAHETLTIGGDGTVSVVPLGLGPESVITVDRIRLVNADTSLLQKAEDGLFRLKDGSQAEPDAAVRIASGNLETSNVNTVDAMVTMIALARQFEMQIKMMKTADSVAESGARLMRLE